MSCLPPEQHPSNPHIGRALLGIAVNALEHRAPDAKIVATLIRHGADWRNYPIYSGGPSLLHDIIEIPSTPQSINDDPDIRIARMAEAIGHVLDMGVTPFLMNDKGVSAYEAARVHPVVALQFRANCKPIAERVDKFDPVHEPLLDKDKKPTDLLLYCCSENRLGEVLAQRHWPNPMALIKVKHAIKEALSPHLQEKFSADLDTTAQMRGTGASGALTRFPGPGQGGR